MYYTPKGKSFHLSRNCSRLSKSRTVYSGQLNNVISGHSDSCDFCVKYTSSTTSKRNKNGTTTSSSNSNTKKNDVVKLNVNKEKLNKYLENSYKKAFGRDIDGEGLNY